MAAIGMLLAASTSLSGCVGVCSTIGYINNDSTIVQFAEALPTDATVAACFGSDCEPAAVPGADGKWVVPQVEPYLADATAVGGRALLVVVTLGDGTVVHEEVHEIPLFVERTGWLGQCPGPASYEPLHIDIANG